MPSTGRPGTATIRAVTLAKPDPAPFIDAETGPTRPHYRLASMRDLADPPWT